MPLRLCVISTNRNLLGAEQEKEFAAGGGTIGRNADNDWVLPDPNRYISGRHALIDFQGGAYYLVDTSRNGVYINGADTPVGRGHPQRLFAGDQLRFGDYDMKVVITEDTTELIDDGMRDSVVRAQLVEEDESMELALVDAGRMVDEDGALARHLAGENSEHLSQLNARIPADQVLADRDPGSEAADRAVEILLKAAGIKPADIAGCAPADVLQTAGQLLRGLVGGLMGLMNERAYLKDAFRLSNTMIQSADNNPLKFSPSVGEALQYLLGDRSKSYLSSAEAIDASFREISNHEKAVPRAMQQALVDFLGHLDPDELRTRFDQGLKRNPLLAGTNRLKYWELYEESYHTLTYGEEGKLPQAFSDEFARAYKHEVEILQSARPKLV